MEPLPSLEALDNTVFGVTERKRQLPVVGKPWILIVLIVKNFCNILFMKILLSAQTVLCFSYLWMTLYYRVCLL